MNYIIDFIDSLTRAEIDAYCSGSDLTIIKQFEAFGNVFLCSSTTEPSADPLIESIVLDDDGGIQLLAIDQTLTDSTITKDLDINADENWWKVASIGTLDFDEEINTHIVRGYASTVYVLDSGIDVTHDDLANANITLLYSVTGDFTDNKGHGTALTSLISGETCGLSGAAIKVVKLFNDNSLTLQSDLLAGFDAVVTDFLESGRPASVVNCSWAIPFNEYINAKIQYLIDLGVFVVAAAGNSGIPINDVTPASIPDVLTIGSFGEDLTPSDFSNYTGVTDVSLTKNETNSGELDGWAPGENIYFASIATPSSYGRGAGTSFSAAIASGALAYNLSRYIGSLGETYEKETNFVSRKSHIISNIATKASQLDDRPNPFLQHVLSRKGILDLSDPKYVSSDNYIVTYVSNAGTHGGALKIVRPVANELTTHMLFDRYSIERVVAVNNVPSWLSVDERGIVIFDNPPLDDGLNYKILPSIEFDTYYRDGSVGSFILSVTVTKDELNMYNVEELLPDGDPLIKSILLACQTASSPCGDDCIAPEVCEFITKSNCFCLGA